MIREEVDNVQDTGEYPPFADRVSKFYEAEPRTRMRIVVAGKTHPGLVRHNNEDQYLAVKRYRGREVLTTSYPEGLLEPTEDRAYMLAVADGMGGQRFGQLASLLAMRSGFELGGDEIKWTVRVNDREIAELRQKAEVFCRLLNESLAAEVRENPKLAGMGTTLTICYSAGPNLFTVHVGDSRAYLYRNGTLSRLTRDHNLGQVLIDAGEAEPDSEEVLRVRHILTNCLGGPGGVKVDVDHYMLEDGDRVLLCTDGLNDMIGDDMIGGVLGRNPEPAAACAALVEAALEAGGRDNVTVLVASYYLDEQE